MSAVTERDVLEALRQYHAKVGNGGSGEYAFLTHVRNAAGFGATRTMDALAVSLWPSRGLTLTGYEVKVSRSDWLRELKDPAKADEVCGLVDRFALVTPADIVKEGELPPTWGHLVLGGTGKIRAKVPPPLLRPYDARKPPHITRSFLVALLRAAGTVPDQTPVEDQALAAARQEGYREATEHGEQSRAGWQKRAEAAETSIRAFQQQTGLRLSERGIVDWSPDRAADIGKHVQAVMNGDEQVERARLRLAGVAAQLRRTADDLDNRSLA